MSAGSARIARTHNSHNTQKCPVPVIVRILRIVRRGRKRWPAPGLLGDIAFEARSAGVKASSIRRLRIEWEIYALQLGQRRPRVSDSALGTVNRLRHSPNDFGKNARIRHGRHR